jgi:hypothetical protein
VDLLSGGYPGVISVFRNVSTSEPLTNASFAAPVNLQVRGWVHSLALGDLNGDRRPEIVAVGELSNFMTVFENLSTPGSLSAASLGEPVDFQTGWNAWGVSVGDLNGDGEPEIVFANQYDDDLMFYENKSSTCVLPPGLVAWWRAEGNANDALGSSNGSLQGGTTFVPGEVGNAFSFDGVDDFVLVNATATLDVGAGAGFTLECWIKPEGLRAEPILVWGTDAVGVQLWINEHNSLNANLVDTDGHDHVVETAADVVLDQEFQHVALTYDKESGVATIYHNGVAAQSAALGTFTPQTSTDLNLGARTFPPEGPEAKFVGRLDEAAIFNRALAESEIGSIYTAGVVGKCVPRPPIILTHPSEQVVARGESFTLTVRVSGSIPLTYQWRHDGEDIPGATSASLTIDAAHMSDEGVYSVVVANGVGSASGVIATVTIFRLPSTVSLGGGEGSAGLPIEVPVLLRANGDENSVSFSLRFDPQQLIFDTVELGTDAGDAFLLPNLSQVAEGILGVALALPADTVFPEGDLEILKLRFGTGTRPGSTYLSFADQPIRLLISGIHAEPINSRFENLLIHLLPSELEADCALGDYMVNILDWVQVGRFVAGLDPVAPSDFVRVDCAPRETLGDGELKVTDWVQAGRYAAAIDPLTLAGGPTEPVPPSPGGGSGVARIVSVGKAQIQGRSITVPITLTAQGNENAVGFTLLFDAGALTFATAGKGSAAGSATLNVNADQAASGQLGIALALPLGTHFSAGTREVLKVTFQLAATAGGSYHLGFGPGPVALAISNPEAQELAANYLGAEITVQPLVMLNIRLTDTQAILSWPSSATDYRLQVAGAPAGGFSDVTTAVQTADGQNIVVLRRSTLVPQYFRLFRP